MDNNTNMYVVDKNFSTKIELLKNLSCVQGGLFACPSDSNTDWMGDLIYECIEMVKKLMKEDEVDDF